MRQTYLEIARRYVQEDLANVSLVLDAGAVTLKAEIDESEQSVDREPPTSLTAYRVGATARRCRLCGHGLPGWLKVQNRPDGAMLLNHLTRWHPTEVKGYLDRMRRDEDVEPVVMEVFERVEAPT